MTFFSHHVDPSGLSAEPPCQPQPTCSLTSTKKITPTTPALQGLRREDQEFTTSLGYSVRLSPKREKFKKKTLLAYDLTFLSGFPLSSGYRLNTTQKACELLIVAPPSTPFPYIWPL